MSIRDTAEGKGLSVIVPAFNEAGAIAAEVRNLLRVLEALERPYELIVVDDGSSDSTADQAEEGGAEVLRLPENRGYGAAIQAGMRHATHDWIIITDADGTYPADQIPELLARSEGYEMVVGARTGDDVHIPLIRRPAKWFLRQLASFLAGRQIPDLNSGLRLMRRRSVERFLHILPSGFSFTTTITLAMMCNGLGVCYHPINYNKRVGTSKIRPSHAGQFFLLIVRTIVYFNPLKIFLPLGALMFVAALAKFVYDVFQSNLSESAVLGFLGAVIVWAIGLLSDQLARVGSRQWSK